MVAEELRQLPALVARLRGESNKDSRAVTAHISFSEGLLASMLDETSVLKVQEEIDSDDDAADDEYVDDYDDEGDEGEIRRNE